MKTTNITTPSPIPTPEKAFKTIMKQINDVFNNEQFFDSSKFQKLLDKILQGEHRAIPEDKESQEKCFETIAYILNNICNNTQIKKFYNTAPSTSLTQYAQKTTSDQLLNNIYHNNRQRFYKENIGGGNCHHRTVLFKKIFDIFQSQGLQVQSKIIAYKNIGGHSFVFVTFQGKEYIVDVGGFDLASKKAITPVAMLEKNMQAMLKTHIKGHRQINSFIIIYDDPIQFAQYIDAKPIKNISIQFKPKLEKEHISNEIDIAINKKFISITIDKITYNVAISENYKPSDRITNNQQLFNDILNNGKANSETKVIYNKYIYMLADKISYHKIKSLWSPS